MLISIQKPPVQKSCPISSNVLVSPVKTLVEHFWLVLHWRLEDDFSAFPFGL